MGFKSFMGKLDRLLAKRIRVKRRSFLKKKTDRALVSGSPSQSEKKPFHRNNDEFKALMQIVQTISGVIRHFSGPLYSNRYLRELDQIWEDFQRAWQRLEDNLVRGMRNIFHNESFIYDPYDEVQELNDAHQHHLEELLNDYRQVLAEFIKGLNIPPSVKMKLLRLLNG
mmetsp:Transcript_17825/g.21648  ORF Transcript_17825/g.21648 Transcript_17825/m.21648 type:complete len:169 (-) Transcript_17825:106-612(-)